MSDDYLTEAWIENFSDSTIYERGYDYYQSKVVYALEYDPSTSKIKAKVRGNYGNYHVTIDNISRKTIDAFCNCPYDGYPCKHIVAVLLEFINNRQAYYAKASFKKNQFRILAEKLNQCSQQQLSDIILKIVQHNPDVKRAVFAILQPDSLDTLRVITDQIDRIRLDNIDNDYSSEFELIREFKKILKDIEAAGSQVKIAIGWAITDKILAFLNDYGISDERWEDLAIEAFDIVSNCLQNTDQDHQQRQVIIAKLQEYYQIENCGIVDYIDNWLEQLRTDR